MFSLAMSLPALFAVWRCVFNCVCVDLLLTSSCMLFEMTCVSCHAARGQHPKRSIYELTEEKPYWAQRKSQVSWMFYCFICIKWMLRLRVSVWNCRLFVASYNAFSFFFLSVFNLCYSLFRFKTKYKVKYTEKRAFREIVWLQLFLSPPTNYGVLFILQEENKAVIFQQPLASVVFLKKYILLVFFNAHCCKSPFQKIIL